MDDALFSPFVAILGLTGGYLFLRYGRPALPIIALLAVCAGLQGPFRPEMLQALQEAGSALAKAAILRGDTPPRVSLSLLNWSMVGYFAIYVALWLPWALAAYGVGWVVKARLNTK